MGETTGGLPGLPVLAGLLGRHDDEDTPGEYHQPVSLSGSPTKDIKHRRPGLAWLGRKYQRKLQKTLKQDNQ